MTAGGLNSISFCHPQVPSSGFVVARAIWNLTRLDKAESFQLVNIIFYITGSSNVNFMFFFVRLMIHCQKVPSALRTRLDAKRIGSEDP